MEVILLEPINRLGELGDTVQVKAGFARNFLIPQRKAVRATLEAKEEVEKRRSQLVTEEKERLDVAKARADAAIKILTFAMNVIDEEGRLFGSVSTSEIVDQAAADGTEILRSEVDMPDGPIKNTGEYVVNVKLHPEVNYELNVIVTAGEQGSSIEEMMVENSEAEDVEQVMAQDTAPESELETAVAAEQEPQSDEAEEQAT